MKNKKEKEILVDTRRVHLVDIRFYEGTGIEIEDEDKVSKAIVIEKSGLYINVITGESLPYFRRVPYSSYTNKGMAFGTKLFTRNKDLLQEKGICYVEITNKFIEEIKQQEKISYKDLKEKILYSDLYFKDRIRIVEERINETKRTRKLLKIAHKDWENNCYFKEKLDNLRDGIQKRK